MKTIKLGNNINTDDIIPARRCTSYDKNYLGKYALEYMIDRSELLNSDKIVAGENFGCGSSREHAPIALIGAGIKEIFAKSYATIFYRNAINVGLKIKSSLITPKIIDNIINFGGIIPYNKFRLQSKKITFRNKTQKRPMTTTEKILAQASSNNYVKPGEIIFTKPNLIMSHDAVVAAASKIYENHFNFKIKSPKNIIFVADHFIQINDIRKDIRAKELYEKMMTFAQKYNIKVYDKISENEAQGICHILLPEQGLIRPGEFIVGTDSHTCTYGALGAFSVGIGTTDLANLFAMGDLWIKVPETIKIEINGRIPKNITAKDIILYILKDLKNNIAKDKVLEFSGEVINRLSIDGRMTLSNMSIEAGAICGIIIPDEKTFKYVKEKTTQNFKVILPDKNAEYFLTKKYNISNLKSQVAKPYSPNNVENVSSLKKIKINKAYIGSCTGGKLEDLKNASNVLKNKKIKKGVELYIVPATQKIKKESERFGYMKIFRDSGAIILPSGCGACINAGRGVLKKNEVGIFATNRNFMGRNGDKTSKVYLASPIIVAKSAIKGYISG